MRILVAATLLGTAFVAAPLSQTRAESEPSDSLERAFVANGHIRMDLSAGEYRISGIPENRIRLQWSVRDGEQRSSVRARADVRESQATIITDGPMNHFKVAIQVPARADLYVRLTAGELRLERVEGNKDIESHAGELDIDVGRAEDYHRVDASVWAGELRAAPYQIFKEGLFRSFDWSGKGRYRLHAHLKAGEIRLRSKSSSTS
jgi:hypothetical protein